MAHDGTEAVLRLCEFPQPGLRADAALALAGDDERDLGQPRERRRLPGRIGGDDRRVFGQTPRERGGGDDDDRLGEVSLQGVEALSGQVSSFAVPEADEDLDGLRRQPAALLRTDDKAAVGEGGGQLLRGVAVPFAGAYQNAARARHVDPAPWLGGSS